MGYFPNSTAAEIFFADNCTHCTHHSEEDDAPECPVWMAHLLFCYDQFENPDLRTVLSLLIPDDPNLAEPCAMFVERTPGRCRRTKDMFAET